jgi:hypothetical protein
MNAPFKKNQKKSAHSKKDAAERDVERCMPWAVMVTESVGTSGLIATELVNDPESFRKLIRPSVQLSKCLPVLQ